MEASQPITADSLKALYVEFLEVQNARLQVEVADRQVRERETTYNATIAKAFTDAGLVAAEWNVNLKAGTMTRKETP